MDGIYVLLALWTELQASKGHRKGSATKEQSIHKSPLGNVWCNLVQANKTKALFSWLISPVLSLSCIFQSVCHLLRVRPWFLPVPCCWCCLCFPLPLVLLSRSLLLSLFCWLFLQTTALWCFQLYWNEPVSSSSQNVRLHVWISIIICTVVCNALSIWGNNTMALNRCFTVYIGV